MDEPTDRSADIWHSEEFIERWIDKTDNGARSPERQFRLMGELLPFDSHESFTFMDLGAGTGAAARGILDLYPLSTAILADYSRPMMVAGEREMQPFAGRFRYVEFDMSVGRWPPQVPAKLDAVVTSMCIHHMPDRRKQGLFREIFEHLAPGGWYLNYDTVTATDPVVVAAWDRADARSHPDDGIPGAPLTSLEQAGHEDHIRNVTALEPQVGFLRSAGFEGIDVYWKRLDAVIYGGRRPLIGGDSGDAGLKGSAADARPGA
ncbi:MAG: class I SAM-dependent methyltransferase [Brooklawnia sp.]|uniref:class I SAM-dependent methyltransferase n=1 Tax=Brooklawnia sp. TaxID=2699740 RepID=UPI003C7646A0